MMASNESGSLPYDPARDQASGWKFLPGQFCSFPFIGHLQFADKKDLLLPGQKEALQTTASYLSSSKNKYQQFLRQKGRYPSLDLYACFQPFNEAFRALFPFVDYIRQSMKEGDLIVNLWDRSGWTAHMLAGWFPQQKIVTVWEGDKDILGYRGFDYWMSQERQEQHTVVFAYFLRPLPFEDASAAAVIGMDLLHRFHQPELLGEINRIAKPQAPVIFPHVHLTNNEPEPFFERGCRQLHGKDYQFLFDRMASFTCRQGYILSEPALFHWNDQEGEIEKILVSTPDHRDYNACIAWLPGDRVPYLKRWQGHDQEGWEEMYLLQNPLLTLAPGCYDIQLNENAFQETIHELLERHPVYARRIQDTLGAILEEDSLLVLYWAMQGLRIGEIRQRLGWEVSRMQAILRKFKDLDLAQAVPVSETGFRLQTLLGQQRYMLERKESNLAAFWKQAVAFHPGQPWVQVQGEAALSYEQADELIGLIKKALLAEGLKKGDKIMLCASMHTEVLLLFWAAVSLGITIVPLSTKESPARMEGHINQLRPALVLSDPALYPYFLGIKGCAVLMTDCLEDEAYQTEGSFQEWLEKAMEKEEIQEQPVPAAGDTAVILWTTGSTGDPKGIPISHAQLIRSGRLMTETYHWKKSDRYLALGGLEAMSGLRHATVSLAEAGACCVIAPGNRIIFDHLHTITTENITILTANPIFFKQLLVAARGKLASKIRLALSTGNQLTVSLRESWQKNTGIPLYNYYGLTETSGICIAEPLGFSSNREGSIGLPLDCLVRIVDEDGQEVPRGKPGELCIYGAGIFSGYENNPRASLNSIRKGWFYTKDLAVWQEDGGICLGGRLSDIIKLPTGERLELSAIEDAMGKVPFLKDWAVCSLPGDEKEEIAVFLVPEPSISYPELRDQIQQIIKKEIGSFALPKLIEPVPFIPRGNHNKLLKQQLISQYFQSIKM
ncbi:MAG: class I adenylate-forming enzyme family protein [Flavisolibacter sp.]